MNKALTYGIFAVALLFSGRSLFCMSEKEAARFIEKMFQDVVEDLHADEQIISQYFSPLYLQYVDGHVVNYNEFIEHMKAQKSSLSSIQISIERCVSQDNKICTVHRVHATKQNGIGIGMKVIAYFEIEDGKIVLCDELTHLIAGEEEDRNLASIR